MMFWMYRGFCFWIKKEQDCYALQHEEKNAQKDIKKHGKHRNMIKVGGSFIFGVDMDFWWAGWCK